MNYPKADPMAQNFCQVRCEGREKSLEAYNIRNVGKTGKLRQINNI
jgi:hypothetical protein